MRQRNSFDSTVAGEADQAKIQVELAKTRTEQVKTRAELARTRKEQARTRAELAKTRVEQVKTRAELAKAREEKTTNKQVEKTLQKVVHKEFDLHDRDQQTQDDFNNQKNILQRLTSRQREILRLIAKSRNTKQIAGILKVSPKTIEYHRSKLMAALSLHDVPGLVRFALRAGLIPTEG